MLVSPVRGVGTQGRAHGWLAALVTLSHRHSVQQTPTL